MSDHFQPLSFKQIAKWVFTELEDRHSIFGIPQELFFRPAEADPFRTALYGQLLETPFGVAAGPHSQMAQNIVAAWLQGARFIELKTVQTLDEIKVSKPCIDMQDEGYNVEWSQELKIDQSFREYLMAWVLIHALHRRLGFPGATPGVIFNMSVGYNLEGVLKPNVQSYLARMANAGDEFQEALDAVAEVYPEVRGIAIPTQLSDNVTLSTMHGCPPEEIGKIAAYLIEDRGLHTNVKLNPTLLGPDALRDILNRVCGFSQITVPDAAFGHDLKYPDALTILRDLRARAAAKGVIFGVKLSNTLEVENHRTVFSPDEKMMYMSGRPLQAVTVNLAAKLQNEFAGDLRISYAGGADAFNVADLLACGFNTITSSSDLLRPGGYARLLQYLSETRAAMAAASANNLPTFIQARAHAPADSDLKAAALANLRAYAAAVLESPAYKRDTYDRRATKTSRPLSAFDCIAAPCRTTCPLSQDVPEYLRAIASADFDAAARVIRDDNAMAATLGRACNHACETTCVRSQFDQPLAIRELKRAALEYGKDPALAGGAGGSPAKKVAIVGAGPCGLSTASFLRAAGVEVDIYDAAPAPGGMAAQTLPAYRALPELVEADADRLAAAGVRFHYGQAAGRDFALADLLAGAAPADAVVIAAGARFGAPLGVPGDDLPGVLDGIDFLRRVRTGDLTALSGPVAIVGGGDVAMDCARVAKRLGATPSVIYRRTRDEMPAHRDELEGLLSEGIPVQNLLAPAAVQEGPDGHAAVLLCTPMQLGEPDASGRRRPVPVPGADPVAIPASAVIAAIGQRPDLAFATAAGVALNKKGYIDADPATGATSVPHIYAGGDAVNNGPSTLVKALADGRAIAAHLLGHPVGRSVKANAGNPVSNYAETLRKRATRVPRHEPATTPAEKRMSFDEVVLPLSREDAIAEARRCLSCDTFCSICTSVCPNHAFLTYQTLPKTLTLAAWTFENGVATPAEPVPFAIRQANQTAVLTDFCNECANCATFCPTAGRPYREKPRLYASESEFLDQADNAYRITGEGASRAIAGRLGGATHALVPTSEGYLYTSPLFTIQLSKDLAPLAAPVPAAPDASGPADLLFAATLHTLLTSIAPSQLPPVP